MGLFKRIKSSFKRRRNIANIYNPFFKNAKRDLSSLEILSEDIPKDVEQLYEELKQFSNTYEGGINLYKQYKKDVKRHNKEIEAIIDGMKGFDYGKIIENPHKFNKNDFNKYEIIASKIANFPKRDAKYSKFCEDVRDVNLHLEHIQKQYDMLPEYKKLIDFRKDIYIDNNLRDEIKKKASDFKKKVDSISDKHYYQFDLIENIDDYVDSINKSYIDKHIKDRLLDNVNGRSLDYEQREAVLQDEVASLTIAGAGSGKTLTICGKVKFLIDKLNVKPEDILLLSYSKKSAEDLQLKANGISHKLTVGTFHKLGLDILKNIKQKNLDVEEQYGAIIEEYFREEMFKNPVVLEKILNYYALFSSFNSNNKKYSNKGELYSDLREADFDTLKCQLYKLSNNIDKMETIKHEHVKSYQELAIANFYFINGIKYEYEKPYEKDLSTSEHRQYTPDFYLKDYGFYHEHYGINKNGEASQYSAEEGKKYVFDMQWKHRLHEINNTDCLETFSYEFDDGTVFEKLEKELKKRGVKFNPLSNEEIKNALNSIYNNQEFKSLIALIKTFISLYKSRYKDESYFEKLKNNELNNKFLKLKSDLFLDICKNVYIFYSNKLKVNKRIDFDDMILQSKECLNKIDGFKYKYIIVDEFQDISYSRMLFLKELIKHGNSKLFAVGDDWQAIYRFSGCDINIFLKFEEYFGKSKINYITSTHRNSLELQNVAGPFIKANPEQFDKTIKSNIHLDNPIQIAYYDENKYLILTKLLSSIYKKEKTASVLLLGRNNHDIDILLSHELYINKNIKNKDKITIHYSKCPELKISYSTVHSSKGLEDEYVIIISADDEKSGFPNKVEDDPLLNLVLSDKSKYLYAEERRLWYVALTRTKTYVFIIANRSAPSMFVKEIESFCRIMNPEHKTIENYELIMCPNCKSGHLVLRETKDHSSKFYGCSNYPFCDYTIDKFKDVNHNKRCPECGDFLIVKKGKTGLFYGCHSYPYCKHTEQINKK